VAHRLARQARADLDQIWDYIHSQTSNEAVADQVIDAIAERFGLLAQWPHIGRQRSDLRRGLRSHPVGNYLIFYRIQRAGIVILRVLHSRRDIAGLFGG
jgi:toxin ParE1/3/4